MKILTVLVAIMLCFGFASSCLNETEVNVSNNIDMDTYEQQVVSNYVNKYMVSTNANNFVIGIILREISLACITNDMSSWDMLLKYKSAFFQNITTNIISTEYPVRPSSDDIDITSGYIGSISETTMEAYPELLGEMKRIVPKFSNILIFRINEYEYNKRQNQ